MIPFGTLIQAAGSMPAMGSGGTGNSAAANNGLAQARSAQADGEASDSFAAWVRKRIGDDSTMTADGDVMDSAQDEVDKLEGIDWEQLMTLIADAMDLSPELSDEGQGLSDTELSNMKDALQQLANTGLLTDEAHPLQGWKDFAMDLLTGSDPVLDPRVKSMTDGKEMSGGGPEKPFPGIGAAVSGVMAGDGAASDPTATTGPGLETAGLNRTQESAGPNQFENAFQAKQGQGKSVPPVETTVAHAEQAAQEKNPEVNAQRRDERTEKVPGSHDQVSYQKDSQQIKTPLSVETGKNDGNPTATDENSPDNRHTVQRDGQAKQASVNADEKELPKGTTASDSIKIPGPEQNRFSDTIQDVTRTTTEKSGGIQPAPSERGESPAVQRFQTTVMDQIVDKANFRSVQGRSEIQIRLKPDFLGNVQMNIAADKEQVVVRMITDHPVVKEVIEANLHHLKTELQHQGLTIDRFEVTVHPDAGQQQNREQFAQMFKNPSFQDGRGQDHAPEPETHQRENGNSEDGHRSGGDPSEEKGINYFA